MKKLVEMPTREAVTHILTSKGITKYRLAKNLDVGPINVSNWLAGTRMSADTAVKFRQLYSIYVTDQYLAGRHNDT